MQLRNAIDILFHPDEEWSRMEDEESNRVSLLRYGITCLTFSFALIFAWMLIQLTNKTATPVSPHGGLYWTVTIAIRFVLTLISLLIIPPLLAELAPSFQGERNTLNALKLYVFVQTPAWLGIIFGMLGAVSGSIYSIYLLWKFAGDALAIPPLKKMSFVLMAIFLLTIVQWFFFAIGAGVANMIVVTSPSS